MARPLRIQYPGAFYHITSRGNEKRPIFNSRRDREKLLSFFSGAAARYGVSIHCYCLMENHYHLLLEITEENLSQALHLINGGYTTYFNRVYDRSGHLFQGRYRAILVERDEYASVLSRYIHLNPVRAGISRSPGKYPWSSYSAYLDPMQKPAWLNTSLVLGYFGAREGEARKKYREFVEEGGKRQDSDPLHGVVSGVLLGSERFVEWIRNDVIKGAYRGRDVPALRQLGTRLSVEKVKGEVKKQLGAHRWLRDVSIYFCHRYTGETLRKIGEEFGGMGESAVSQAIGRLVRRMKEDRRLEKEVLRMEQEIEGLSRV